MLRQLAPADFLFLLRATQWTLLLSLAGFAGGTIIGLPVALMRTGPSRPPRWVAIGYIRVIQGIPLLLLLFLVYFGSDMIGWGLTAWWSAALGLSINAGAFLGEIWRGAIEAVPAGQGAAATALGLGFFPRLALVIVPQAVRLALPPTVGFMVHLIKSTSLAAIIGFVELTQAGHLINSATFRPFPVFGAVAVIYFLLCSPLTLASRRLERRLASYQRP